MRFSDPELAEIAGEVREYLTQELNFVTREDDTSGVGDDVDEPSFSEALEESMSSRGGDDLGDYEYTRVKDYVLAHCRRTFASVEG